MVTLGHGGLGRDTLRSYALFAAAALAPALAVGALGLRALRNEEAAVLRETAVALDAAAERASLGVHQGVADGATRLAAASFDADPARTAETLRALTPAFAEPVVLGSDRTVLLPAAAPRALEPAPARCGELVSALRTDRRDAARREILERCREARDPTGRWLWPIVALEGLGPEDAEALAGWLEAHAGMLGAAERQARSFEARAAGALTGTPRERALRALETSGSRRDALLVELRDDDAAAALRKRRGAPASSPDDETAGALRKREGADPSTSWRARTSLGQLRSLPDGRMVGFVVHRLSLAEAIGSGWLKLGPDQRARVVWGAAMHATRDETTMASVARAESLGATVAIAPDLGLRVVPSDPGTVVRHASRSRTILGVLAGTATVVAFAVATLLFSRMRAAKRSSELRTDFVSIVSHELRTPIASIRMLSELLEQGRVEEGERQEVHEAIARESRRLGETVDRLLGFSRMAAGRYVVTREDASVAEAVAPSIDTFEERHPDAPRVVRELDPAARAPIDAPQLRLAVDNLLANARKYAPDGGPYTVRVARENGGVLVRVEDKGPGIARRDQKRIFEPFERVDDRLSRATEGSGIGLSLVRHVALAHGGEAKVESEPGRGAAFTMWIPARTKE